MRAVGTVRVQEVAGIHTDHLVGLSIYERFQKPFNLFLACKHLDDSQTVSYVHSHHW